jgi:hypothetical protein
MEWPTGEFAYAARQLGPYCAARRQGHMQQTNNVLASLLCFLSSTHLDGTLPFRDSWDLSGVMDSVNELDTARQSTAVHGYSRAPAAGGNVDDAKILRCSLENMSLEGDDARRLLRYVPSRHFLCF